MLYFRELTECLFPLLLVLVEMDPGRFVGDVGGACPIEAVRLPYLAVRHQKHPLYVHTLNLLTRLSSHLHDITRTLTFSTTPYLREEEGGEVGRAYMRCLGNG